MVRECTHGGTAANIVETTSMTRNMAMAHTLGLMDENMKVNGLMASKLIGKREIVLHNVIRYFEDNIHGGNSFGICFSLIGFLIVFSIR